MFILHTISRNIFYKPRNSSSYTRDTQCSKEQTCFGLRSATTTCGERTTRAVITGVSTHLDCVASSTELIAIG